ncbi:hypothetical protein E2320_017005, partial [Naja naja]
AKQQFQEGNFQLGNVTKRTIGRISPTWKMKNWSVTWEKYRIGTAWLPNRCVSTKT